MNKFTHVFVMLLTPLMAAGLAQSAFAHGSEPTEVSIQPLENGIWAITLDMNVVDLNQAIGLKLGLDGHISRSALRESTQDLHRYATNNVKLVSDESNCNSVADSEKVLIKDRDRLLYTFTVTCQASAPLFIDYRLFSDIDASTHGVLRIQDRPRPVALKIGTTRI